MKTYDVSLKSILCMPTFGRATIQVTYSSPKTHDRSSPEFAKMLEIYVLHVLRRFKKSLVYRFLMSGAEMTAILLCILGFS